MQSSSAPCGRWLSLSPSLQALTAQGASARHFALRSRERLRRRPFCPESADKFQLADRDVARVWALGDEATESAVAEAMPCPEVPFDVGHCVALAGCSFEAYSDPESQPAFAERSVTGTTTVYTDRSYVQENFQALLQLRLRGASKLPARDLVGKSDPYVRMSVEGSTAVSEVVSSSLSPTWNETFYLYVRDVSKAVLTVRVFDLDVFKSDDALGVSMFPLRKLQFYESENLDLELQSDGGGGCVYLTAKLLPFDETEEAGFDAEDIASIAAAEGIEDLVRESFDPDADLPRPALELQDCPSAWRALAVVAGKRAEDLFDPICFVENPETDTQVWLYRNVQRKECVVAFRGTEQFKWRDLVTDTTAKPAVFDVERSSLYGSVSLDPGDLPFDELLVHHGFLEAYDSVRACLFALALSITSGSPDWTIYTTGHSLGGALATLCAYEMQCRWLADPPQVKMYNFGSPRVGNRAFAEAFDRAICESWRIVSRRDLVTTVPRLAGYSHVRSLVSVDRQGTLLFGEESTEADHLEGKDMSQFLGRMSFEEIGKVVLDYEMELMKRLMDGSGLREHMEENYLACLQCTIRPNRP